MDRQLKNFNAKTIETTDLQIVGWQLFVWLIVLSNKTDNYPVSCHIPYETRISTFKSLSKQKELSYSPIKDHDKSTIGMRVFKMQYYIFYYRVRTYSVTKIHRLVKRTSLSQQMTLTTTINYIGHYYLLIRESKSTSKPGTERTTKWVAWLRFSLILPPPIKISSFNLLSASFNKTCQSAFLNKSYNL